MKIENTTRGEHHFMNADDIRLVIITDKNHRLYDERVLLPVSDAMVSSIADPSIGVLEPVIVRKVQGARYGVDGWAYEVMDGRQRVKAAREAQKRTTDRTIRVPIIVRSGANDAAAASMAAIANNQRVEETPMQKGLRAQMLIETGHSREELCSIFGVGWQTVHGWISISESPEVADKISSGEITATEAAKEAKRKTSKRNLKPIEKPTENIRIIGKRFGDGWRIKVTRDAYPGDIRGFIEALSKTWGMNIEVVDD